MLRLAAIDVGSNAIRLLMVELTGAGKLVDTRFRRYPLRLGTAVFAKGAISAAEVDELVEIFTDIARQVREAGIERYRAVGTAAMREAKNRRLVVKRIAEASGLRLEIIDGEEESRLSGNALWRAVGWAPRETLLFDLGGGSFELERAQGRRRVSLPLGTVRLLELYPQLAGPLPEAELWRLVDEVSAALRRLTRMRKPTAIMIGTGGNLASLAAIIPAPAALLPAIDVARLPELMVTLAGQTVEERSRAYPLRPDRAELVVAGAVVLTALIRRFAIETCVVPGTGLRESMLHELTAPPPIEADLRELVERHGRAPGPTAARARLARQLFEVTASVHGLWPPALTPLVVAAYVLSLGEADDPRGAGERAAAAIRDASGLDIDAGAREVAARIALAAADGGNDELFAGLAGEDVIVARRNAALLRLAMAIRERRGRSVRRAQTLSCPLTIECGVARELPREVVAYAERALDCVLQFT